MRKSRREFKKINNKLVLVIFFITMFFFGTSYAILRQDLNLTGTVGIFVDENTDLTVTNFNTSINPIYTQYILRIIPVSGYKVVGITVQNTLSRTIDNWTVEFTSSRTAETTRPTDNRLSAYLNPENYYSSISNSNGTVIVRGNDTLAPGQSKTVYVFFSCNLLNTNINFGTPTAYYTPPNGRRSAPARNSNDSEVILKKYDEKTISDIVAVHISYETVLVAGNLYNTTMYVFLGNATGGDISNMSFDVTYNDSNVSSLAATSINILSNNEHGASFKSDDTIKNNTCNGYIVTGLKTYGGFNGMTISNINYATGGNSSKTNVDDTTNNSTELNNDEIPVTKQNDSKTITPNQNNSENTDTSDTKVDNKNTSVENTIQENNTVENTIDDNDIQSKETTNEVKSSSAESTETTN